MVLLLHEEPQYAQLSFLLGRMTYSTGIVLRGRGGSNASLLPNRHEPDPRRVNKASALDRLRDTSVLSSARRGWVAR